MEKLGSWAFVVGIVLAIIFGFLPAAAWVAPVLVVLGLVIGFLNITEKEVNSFLIAAVALVMAGTAELTLVPPAALGNLLQAVVNNFVVLMAPAAIVVAVKSVWELAGNR